MGKGIIKCALEIDDVFVKFIKPGDTIFMGIGKKYKFYIKPTLDFFDKGTILDMEKKVSKAKWAYIMDSFWDNALKKKDQVYNEWGSFNKNTGDEFVRYLGIGNQYKQGDSIEFYFDENNKTNFWMGSGYRVEVFNGIPNDGLYFTVVPYLEKHLRYGFFEKPSNKIESDKEKIRDGLLSYGEQTHVDIAVHRFGKSNLDPLANPKDYDVELFLCDDKGEILDEKAIEVKSLSNFVTKPNVGNLNNSFRFSFIISEEWKDKYHPNKEPKVYSLEVRIQSKLENKEGKYPYYSFNIKEKNFTISGNSGEDDHNVTYLTQSFFTVKKSAHDIILLTQQDKTNMIQYIGDIDYNYKEFDPCFFTKISIKELDNKDRLKPYVIFEEGSTTVADYTSHFYDIIAGDNEKKPVKVEVIVDGLTTKGVLCQSILLDEGQVHSNIENVFQTGKIWTAKPIIDQYKTEETDWKKKEVDALYVENKNAALKSNKLSVKPKNNYEDAGVDFKKDKSHKQETGALDHDYDLKPDHKVDGASIQNWVNKEDYIIEDKGSTASFTLQKLVYVYDKKLSGTKNVQTVSSTTLVDDALDTFWMFNYFWLGDNLAQPYFIPVSTCRYTNQLAKIRVYPDMEWEMKLQLSSTQPEALSYTQIPSGDISEKYNEKALEAANNKRWLNKEVSFELTIKAKSQDFEREVSSGYEKKIRDVMEILIKAKETLDEISGVTEAKKGMAANLASKLPKFLGKVPLTVQIDYPVISISGNWKLEVKKDQPGVQRTGTISFGFIPLIKGTGTVDLIACLEFVPAIGVIFKGARMIKDAINNYTPLTAEIWLNLVVKGWIDLKGNIVIGNEEKAAELECDTTVSLGLEMGVSATVNAPKLSFQGRDVVKQEELGLEAEASARGETSLIFKGKRGISTKGMYIEIGIDFGGMAAYVTAKVKAKIPVIGTIGGGVDDKPINILDQTPILEGKRFYFIENNK